MNEQLAHQLAAIIRYEGTQFGLTPDDVSVDRGFDSGTWWVLVAGGVNKWFASIAEWVHYVEEREYTQCERAMMHENYKVIETAIMVMSGNIMNLRTELLVIKQMLVQLTEQKQGERKADTETYRQFLEDTVDDDEYNAYLEHLHTPKADNY